MPKELEVVWFRVKVELTYPPVDAKTGVPWERPSSWDWQGLLDVRQAYVDECHKLGYHPGYKAGTVSYEVTLVLEYEPKNDQGEYWARPDKWRWGKVAEAGAKVIECDKILPLIGVPRFGGIKVLLKEVPKG